MFTASICPTKNESVVHRDSYDATACTAPRKYARGSRRTLCPTRNASYRRRPRAPPGSPNSGRAVLWRRGGGSTPLSRGRIPMLSLSVSRTPVNRRFEFDIHVLHGEQTTNLGVPWKNDFQLLGGCLFPSASYFGGRQMYQSRLGLVLLERDSLNHSCCE